MSKGSHRRGARGAHGVSSARSGSGSGSGSGSEEHAAAGHRHARLSQLCREEIDALLRDEVRDPRLEDVRVTSVELSVDYRNARVRFAVSPGDYPGEVTAVERAFERAAAFLRARLVDAMGTKHAPALRFVHDPDAPSEVFSEDTSETDPEVDDPCRS